ncbi:hypothetical protein GIB67_042996 [Kingdonia uniflora]|uniref:Protein SCAI n=1 Tax=Kingdonia uniflora TaxID=39325 RepID=A0A7J7NT01_9MAGN|nr:hypothetical protein GIB67_042996 [Kingdonia uniflora]
MNDVAKTFRALIESADRKFIRVRDVPLHGRVPHHYFHKVFKAYTKLWKFQQENRSKLVESGLQRWEIGEIASRIGQLYYGQYMRTSETRFLLEAYVFYEAILSRGYFEGGKGSLKDLSLRYKELRFYARFLVVALILNLSEMVKLLVDRFKSLVDVSKATFKETNLKEWKLMVQEIVRFLRADAAVVYTRTLRYCATFDSHSASLPYVARFHAKRILKLQDALLTSYHRHEVKFTELTLDTFRMLQCLEWEPSGSFFKVRTTELKDTGILNDQSAASGFIDINLAADMIDPTLAPNPRKAVLYHPSVTNLISVMATMCEELPQDRILLIYISASGNDSKYATHMDTSGVSRAPANLKQRESPRHGAPTMDNGDSDDFSRSSLWLGLKGSGGSNNLHPTDIIPFTRKPLFLIIDSDNSHAFKVMYGLERGETAAMLLSPQRWSAFRSPSAVDLASNGSQFTFFLTAPLQAFCQLVGFSTSDTDKAISKAEAVLSEVISDWEVRLCTSTTVDLVWAQVLSDPFLRRLILRFIFCRSVLSFICPPEDSDQYMPHCLPPLPEFVSPNSEVTKSSVLRLAKSLGVVDSLRFDGSLHQTEI